jgi:hypothetical protein
VINRGQDRLFHEFLMPRQPPGLCNPREYLYNAKSVSSGKIKDLLYDVIQMRVGILSMPEEHEHDWVKPLYSDATKLLLLLNSS